MQNYWFNSQCVIFVYYWTNLSFIKFETCEQTVCKIWQDLTGKYNLSHQPTKYTKGNKRAAFKICHTWIVIQYIIVTRIINTRLLMGLLSFSISDSSKSLHFHYFMKTFRFLIKISHSSCCSVTRSTQNLFFILYNIHNTHIIIQ